MRFITHSHRHALLALNSTPHASTWDDLREAIQSVDDYRLRREYVVSQRRARGSGRTLASGIQTALNKVLREELSGRGWMKEAKLFRGTDYRNRKWRLDFAKDRVALEVAFNHAEALPHNLVKPTLAGELNHLVKERDAEIGVIVLATRSLKLAGNMDGAVGTYEDALTYLTAYRSILTTPLLLIGLAAPDTFIVEKWRQERVTLANGRTRARFVKGSGRGPKAGMTRRLRGPLST